MAFKALFLAHAPDGDPEKHHTLIDTGRYRLHTVIVKNQKEAIEVSKRFYAEEKIHAVMLCPGFTHKDVAELFEALGGNVSINVSRGDGPSSRIAQPVIQKQFFEK